MGVTLSAIKLHKDLSKASGGGSFGPFPSLPPIAAALWTKAIVTFAVTSIPPSLSHLTVIPTLYSTILQSIVSGTLHTALGPAIQAYAVGMVPGMAPLFTGIPPTVPLTLTPIFNATMVANLSGDITFGIIAGAIGLWASSGIAINPMTGITIPWLFFTGIKKKKKLTNDASSSTALRKILAKENTNADLGPNLENVNPSDLVSLEDEILDGYAKVNRTSYIIKKLGTHDQSHHIFDK